MAARRSTRNAIGRRSHCGANSERKIATPSARGVASTSAMKDETRVPNSAGAAPNSPLTGSQSLENRKPKPNDLKAGQAATVTTAKISSRSAGTQSANRVITPE